MSNVSIFNGTNEYAGFFESYRGGEAAVTITRGTGEGSAVDEGFMVQQYQITAQRGVNTLRFLNMNKVVAQVGAVQGTCQLTGLVGTKEAFAKLLAGGSEGTAQDICDSLTVTIEASSGFNKCDSITPGATMASPNPVKFIASGGIVSAVQITGQIDQNGVMLQTGTVSITFTKLEMA